MQIIDMTGHILTALLLFTISCIAQEVKYPGDQLDFEEAIQTGEGFCIASFQDLGVSDLGSAGSTYYSNAKIKVSRNFLGGEFQVIRSSYSVQGYPPRSKEAAPVIGIQYLMIGSFGEDTFRIRKMVKPSPENIKIVEQILKSQKKT